MSLNICGRFSKMKFGIFESTIEKLDFVCLCETKTDHIPQDELENFHIFTTKKSNGLAILANKRNNLLLKFIENTESSNIIWIAVGIKDTFEFILGAVYIPCEKSLAQSEAIFDKISNDLVTLKSKYDLPFIFMGDFNSRTGINPDFIDFENQITNEIDVSDLIDFETNLELYNLKNRYNADKKVNKNGQCFLDLCKNFGLCLVNGRFGSDKHIGEPTCYKSESGTTIDYIVVSDSLVPQITDFTVGSFDKTLSDFHCPLFINLNTNLIEPESISSNSPPNINVHEHQTPFSKWRPNANKEYKKSFSTEDISALQNKLDCFLQNNTNVNQQNMDSLVSDFNSLFISSAKKINLFKTKTKNRKSKKYERKYPNKLWFDKDCNSVRKDYLNKKYSKKGKKWKSIHKANFKEYNKLLKSKQKIFQKELEQKLRNLKSSNPREYWKIINKSNSSKGKNSNITIGSLFEHFKILSYKEPTAGDNSFDPRNAAAEGTVTEELNAEFTIEEINLCIRNLKNNKASGNDQVINEYLKNCPEEVVVLIVKLFNVILATGIIPEEWCKGLINPIYKGKGSQKSANNYRGITLLSCMGKLFTSVLNNRLTTFLTKRGILGEEQAAFRAGYCTYDHMFVLNCLIYFYKARYEKLFCAFIDYMKAFDLINRAILWSKLIQNEINGKFITVIFNLYLNAKSAVRQGGFISDFFPCNIGVRQGENLSPVLFSIFLNDFHSYIGTRSRGLSLFSSLCTTMLSNDDIEVFIKLFSLLYADDTIVLAETEEDLQNSLVAVYNYCETNGLKVNTEKTKIVIFSNGKVTKHRNFFFGSRPLEVVPEYIYLGMCFSYNGSFSKAIEKQISQATKAMYSLITKARRLFLPLDIVCDLFDKTVLPVLLYSSEIWGCGNLYKVEVFYRKFLKIILKLNNSTPSAMIYGETGKLPITLEINKRMISYWIKVSEDKESKFSNIVYRLMLKLHNPITGIYNFPWFNKIYEILESCNFSNLFRDQQQYSTKQFLKRSIFDALTQSEQEKWLNDVNTNQFCFNYRIFKQNLYFERYLIKLPFYYRQMFSKFRCKNNKLPVNKNRFDKKVVDRNCQLCQKQDLGDEFHYIFICKFFGKERKQYIDKFFYTRPNTQKMYHLFNSQNEQILTNLCKFIAIIIKKFE